MLNNLIACIAMLLLGGCSSTPNPSLESLFGSLISTTIAPQILLSLGHEDFYRGNDRWPENWDEYLLFFHNGKVPDQTNTASDDTIQFKEVSYTQLKNGSLKINFILKGSQEIPDLRDMPGMLVVEIPDKARNNT